MDAGRDRRTADDVLRMMAEFYGERPTRPAETHGHQNANAWAPCVRCGERLEHVNHEPPFGSPH